MNKIAVSLSVLALAFLAFIVGATITRFELFPYGYLSDAFAAAEALLVREGGDQKPFMIGAKPAQPEDWSSPAVRDKEIGLGRYEPDRAYAGLTLYTPVRASFPVRLIDMQGETVHQWQLPFADLAGPRDDGLSLLPKDHEYTVAFPHLFSNGDLLAVLGTTAYTPWGIGIIKLDKDSKLIWKYMKQAHHDADIAPDGRIFALLHTVIRKPLQGLQAIRTPFIDDQVVVLSAAGEELQAVSVMRAVKNSVYQSILQFADPEQPKGDFLHVNSVTYLDAEKASMLPNAAEGDVLISLRQIDVLAVLDLRNETIKWAVRGPWRVQHDPDVLADGKLLLFDNRGDLPHGGTSRVLEFDPHNLAISWEYPGDSNERLYTSIYGSQQRLPNGNTLISESNNGRLLEVTRDKDVVWEYRIPERQLNYRGIEVATAVFAQRFAPDELEFLP